MILEQHKYYTHRNILDVFFRIDTVFHRETHLTTVKLSWFNRGTDNPWYMGLQETLQINHKDPLWAELPPEVRTRKWE
jgi:hypothetical protein